MRILYVSQYFPPEMGAPAARVYETAREWARAGEQVTVLTGFPNHPTGRLAPAYRRLYWRGVHHETVDGISVIRTWLIPLPNRKNLERFVNYTSFSLSASLVGRCLPRPDVLIATSPQLLVGLAGQIVAGRRTPFVFEVRDLWPESLISLRKAEATSPLYRVLDRVAEGIYRRADRVVAVSPAIAAYLIERRRLPAEKVRVVENGVDLDRYAPASPDPVWRARLQRGGRTVISYIGTLGNASYLWTLLEAAKRLRDSLPEAVFALVGEGAERGALEAKAASDRLTNVCFHGEQPRAEIPKIIGASDICLVLLRKDEVFKTVIPSKLLEYMACGRPVILGVDGQARAILEAARAGVFVPPQDPAALAAAIRDLVARRAAWPAMGRGGSEYARQHYCRQQKAMEYLTLLRESQQGR